jgi:hypothetical protein
MIASLLVFIKVLPDLPAIADTTEEFREDQNALIAPPPLPETDTSNVMITSPEIFEPERPEETRGDENVTPEELEPSSQSKTLAGIVDALIYVVIAVIGGFGIYLLFKYRKRMTIKAMFGSLLAIVTVATCIFFGFMVYRMVEFRTDAGLTETQLLGILLAMSAPFGFGVSYSMFSPKVSLKIRNFSLLLIGALMGSFLAALLPLYGVIPLVIAISLFDIYSVKQGPIRKIMTLQDKAEEERLLKSNQTAVTAEEKVSSPAPVPSTEPKISSGAPKPKSKPKKIVVHDAVEDDSDLMLLYEASDWSIGIGDFVMYSMFAAFVLTHTLQFLPYYGFYTPVLGFVLPWLVFLITITGLLVGYTFTLKLLSRKSLMPGLPLAIALGLVSFLGALVIMEIFNFLAYGKFAPIM